MVILKKTKMMKIQRKMKIQKTMKIPRMKIQMMMKMVKNLIHQLEPQFLYHSWHPCLEEE